eukprot:818308-Rhodomonas_salina.2
MGFGNGGLEMGVCTPDLGVGDARELAEVAEEDELGAAQTHTTHRHRQHRHRYRHRHTDTQTHRNTQTQRVGRG